MALQVTENGREITRDGRTVALIATGPDARTLPRPTVKRDGTIVVDGRVIGRVERGHRETITSAILGTDGEVIYRAYSTDGVLIAEDVKRSSAVRTLQRFVALPVVGDVRLVEDSWTRRTYVTADLSWQGQYASVSNYAHERDADGRPQWVVDYFVPRGAFMPMWANGEGTRATRAHILKPEQGDLVTAAVDAVLGVRA